MSVKERESERVRERESGRAGEFFSRSPALPLSIPRFSHKPVSHAAHGQQVAWV